MRYDQIKLVLIYSYIFVREIPNKNPERDLHTKIYEEMFNNIFI